MVTWDDSWLSPLLSFADEKLLVNLHIAAQAQLSPPGGMLIVFAFLSSHSSWRSARDSTRLRASRSKPVDEADNFWERITRRRGPRQDKRQSLRRICRRSTRKCWRRGTWRSHLTSGTVLCRQQLSSFSRSPATASTLHADGTDDNNGWPLGCLDVPVLPSAFRVYSIN